MRLLLVISCALLLSACGTSKRQTPTDLVVNHHEVQSGRPDARHPRSLAAGFSSTSSASPSATFAPT